MTELEKFQMYDDRVLVLPVEAAEKTRSGIIIPETAKEMPARGVVIKNGPGLKDVPARTIVGTTLIYSKYAGSDIELDDTKYKVIRESDVIGYLQPDENAAEDVSHRFPEDL